MATRDCIIHVRKGWRWRLAMRVLPPLLRLGCPLGTCVPVLNWAVRGFRWSMDGEGWAPLFDGTEITLSASE